MINKVNTCILTVKTTRLRIVVVNFIGEKNRGGDKKIGIYFILGNSQTSRLEISDSFLSFFLS